MNFYYNGAWRMDWGLGNPNKTATLIALLMIAIWAIPLTWKKGFWPTLVVFTGLAWCLVETYSRGGMVAFLAGMAVLLAWIPRPWPKRRWISLMTSFWILCGFVLWAKAQSRYGQGLFSEDQSIGNRLIIWKHVPEMMVAAPGGWGFGKGGESYTQWFQPFNQSVHYFNLVNSHFTWMVEGGWLVSVLYIFTWLMVLFLCWPSRQSRLKSLPLAIWVALGVGAFFSHVQESIWLWIIPFLTLGYVIYERSKNHRWPSVHSVVFSGAVSMVIVLLFIAKGLAGTSLSIAANKGEVTIGKGSSHTLIFVDRQVMGSFYGHTLRKFLATNPDQLSRSTFILLESPRDLKNLAVNRVIVSGQLMQEQKVVGNLNPGEQIVIVNPSCSPDEVKLNKALLEKTLVYFGEYSQAPSRNSWSSWPGIKTFQIDGAGDFVPSWPQMLLMLHKT
jgi:hypothetical protein